MRIVYVTATLPFLAGREEFFVPEVRRMVGEGHEVILMPRDAAGPRCRELEGLDLSGMAERVLSPAVLLGSLAEFFERPLSVMRALFRILGKGSPVTRLKNALVFPKGVWLGRWARRLKADHIHVHWASTPATIGLVAHWLSGIPWSITAHRHDIVVANLLEEKVNSVEFVRFISESGVALAEERSKELQREKVYVIPVGVDVPGTGLLPAVRASGCTVFCAASLVPVKGHQFLISAIALLRDRGLRCRLELAGEGTLQGKLEALASELGLAHAVHFLGQISHGALLQRYRRGEVDLFVLPSIDLGGGVHEGIPVALMEAMAFGIPVISTNTGGIPELLGDGAGRIVPPCNPEALADAIEEVVSDVEHRRELATKGRSRVAEQFNSELTTRALLSAMSESCLQARHG